MRAQVLADELDEPDEARKLLANVAERSDNSGPLVQLALLDLKRHDYDAAAADDRQDPRPLEGGRRRRPARRPARARPGGHLGRRRPTSTPP